MTCKTPFDAVWSACVTFAFPLIVTVPPEMSTKSEYGESNEGMSSPFVKLFEYVAPSATWYCSEEQGGGDWGRARHGQDKSQPTVRM